MQSDLQLELIQNENISQIRLISWSEYDYRRLR